MEAAGKLAKQEQAMFRGMAAAQTRAWHEAVEKLRERARESAAEKRPAIDATVERMKAGADDAEAKLRKFKAAGAESWAAYSAALTESRKAFFRANETAWKSLRQAANR